MIAIRKKNNTELLKLIIIIIYFAIWMSLSSNFEDILKIFNNKSNSYFIYLNFLRQISIYFIFILLIFLNINLILKIKYTDQIDLFLFLFLLYILAQIPGLILTDNSLKNFSYIISSSCIIMTINLINYYFHDKEKIIFIIISSIIILIVYSLAFFPNLYNFISGKTNLYGSFEQVSNIFFSKASPRSSGTSRLAILLSIYILIFFNIFDFLKKKFFIKNFILIILFTSVLAYQSRTNIFLLIILILLYYYFQKKFTLTQTFKFFILYFFTPLLITGILFQIYSFNKISSKKINKEISIEQTMEPIRKFDNENFTSGRYLDWSDLLEKSNKKFIIGYGGQADRFLINQSASNGLLYAYSSTGILGSLFYLLFSVLICLKILKNFFLENKYNGVVKFFSSTIILIILLRSVLESSYAAFGIDQIIILTSLIFLRKSA